jgi:hypothetical protein
VDGVLSARDVAVSPDGSHVYVAGWLSNAVAVFERDSITGELTFVEVERDGVGGVDGLEGPTGLAVSADGEHVYASSEVDDAVVTFDRDPVTGELSFIEAIVDGSGAEGLDGAAALALSPDGASLYVAGGVDDAIAVFDRDAPSGVLTVREVHVDTFGGVHGIDGAGCVAVTADGSHVYAGAAAFARDPETGELAFIEETDDRCPLAVSPDVEHRYGLFAPPSPSDPDGVSVRRLRPACDAVPRPACRASQKASISLRDSPIPLKRQFKVSLARADATTIAEFDPGTTNAYGACVYDESGVTPELVLGLLVPARGDCRKDVATLEKPCWTTGKKASYNDRYLTPSGVKTMKLVPSDAQKTAIGVAGRGELLPIADLPYGLPVRLQVQNANGDCWEAVFPSASKNDGVTFKAKAP